MTFRLALFGASPDTPNMGVSALFASAVEGITRELGEVEWVVFDNGLGRRNAVFTMSDGTSLPLTYFGARTGRRYYRPENLAVMHFLSRLGSLGALFNEGLRLIDSCDAVLDVSGGDSFSDLYGWKRFSGVYWGKQIALSRRKPLILLPQTYGPYRDSRVLKLAESVTRGAAMAWARDLNSFDAMKRLLGSSIDPAIHLQGVDMAFGLKARDASGRMPPTLAGWFAESPRRAPLIGINVSGLVYNDPVGARTNFHLIADYRAVIEDFVARLLENTPARIVLVSHVMDQPGHYESDLNACMSVASKIRDEVSERVFVSPIDLDQSEAKWMISKLDWFCGTRMHSTIAALSSGVPTAAVAYSDKTLGVFATCGQVSQVFDPRNLETAAVMDGLWQSYIQRDTLRESLAQDLPRVISLAQGQIRAVAEAIRKAATTGRG